MNNVSFGRVPWVKQSPEHVEDNTGGIQVSEHKRSRICRVPWLRPHQRSHSGTASLWFSSIYTMHYPIFLQSNQLWWVSLQQGTSKHQKPSSRNLAQSEIIWNDMLFLEIPEGADDCIDTHREPLWLSFSTLLKTSKDHEGPHSLGWAMVHSSLRATAGLGHAQHQLPQRSLKLFLLLWSWSF